MNLYWEISIRLVAYSWLFEPLSSILEFFSDKIPSEWLLQALILLEHFIEGKTGLKKLHTKRPGPLVNPGVGAMDRQSALLHQLFLARPLVPQLAGL